MGTGLTSSAKHPQVEHQTWLPSYQPNEQVEQHLIRAITKGSAIAVIGGSFKEEWGTAALIIEGNKNARHRITPTSTAPGTAKYQDAYSSELTGLYHMIYIIETICEKHNIRSGGITAACDGLNAIKKAMDADTKYLCQSNYFNLISTMDNKLMKYPITWSWQHTKGHKYEQGEPLDRYETLNI